MKHLKKLKLLTSTMFIVPAMIILSSLAPTDALSNSVAYFGSGAADACASLQQLNPNQDCDKGSTSVNSLISTIVNIISLIAGALAIIMIVVAGIKFITSGGDASKVSSAKSSLIYALVGIAVVALSQALVHFVLNNASQADPCPSNSNVLASSSQCK
jgi:ABC-type Fe3+-siderophore transport system permease subunit